VWIGLLNEEIDKVDSAKWIIERAEAGEVEIWTSTITLAEVYKIRGASEVDPEGDKKLDEFLSQPYIVHVQVDQDIAMEARRLLRAKLPGLRKPYDAIHLASAVWHNIEVFHTFDRDDLLPLNGLVKCKNGRQITVSKPPERPPPE
jgi:predicted nucleic acid-binding protein